VKEAIATLHGGGPPDFREHCLTVAGLMLLLADRASDLDEARSLLAGSLDDGSAWNTCVDWVTAQGGDRTVLENPDLLPSAALTEDVPAPQAGTIAEIDALEVGQIAVLLGGGREKKGDVIDYGVGVVYHKKVGDRVEEGDRLLTIHAKDENSLAQARQRLLAAISWSHGRVTPPPHTHKIIR
jgi:pyrimidine-nucleoside phosphorylase